MQAAAGLELPVQGAERNAYPAPQLAPADALATRFVNGGPQRPPARSL
jgi:hypothetical protein